MELEKELTLIWQAVRALAGGVHRLGGIDEAVHNIISAAAYAGDRDVKAAEEQAAKLPLTSAEAAELQRLLERYTAASGEQPAAPAPAAPSGPAAFFAGQQPVQPAGAGLAPEDPNYAAPPAAPNPTITDA